MAFTIDSVAFIIQALYSTQEALHLVQVNVNSSNIEQSLRTLKRKLQREGVFRALKLKRHFETLGARKKRKAEESRRRRFKANIEESRSPKDTRTKTRKVQ